MIRKITQTVLIILFIVSTRLSAQTVIEHQVEPKGIAKEVRVAKDNATIEQLGKSGYAGNQALVDTILKHPNDYNPTVLFVLSKVLFDAGQKDEASFWFYVAQLRTRYDYNRCNDKTCAGTTAQLTAMFGPDINQYAIPKLDFIEKTVEKVVEFVKNNNENYDQRWINLNGINVMKASLGNTDKEPEMSKPQKDWPEIKRKTIETYYNDFKEFIASRKK